MLLRTQKDLTEIPEPRSPSAYCRKREKSTTKQRDTKKKRRHYCKGEYKKEKKRGEFPERSGKWELSLQLSMRQEADLGEEPLQGLITEAWQEVPSNDRK